MKNKRGILISLFLFGLWAIYLTGCNLAPGSYPDAELYEVPVSEERLIEAIKKFKEMNSQYSVPKDIPLVDGRRDSQDHWYHFYFYDLERNQIIKTWVRSSGRDKTNFALIGVYDPNFAERWKFVNKDFDREMDKQVKKRFEDDVLNPIKKILD